MLLNNFLMKLFAPDDVAIEDKALSISDMVDAMGDDQIPIETDDKEKEDDDILKPVIEKKEKDGEKEEIEEDLELEEEPEIDETRVEDVPRQAILKKYPDLFKDFPQLETAYYREKKYAELLPTLDDAKEAVAKSENYDKFEGALLNGDLDQVMNSVKGADVRAFNKMVDNYLPILGKVDQNAYYHVIGGVVKELIVSLVKEGNRLENDHLKEAGVILNQFIFGTSEFKPPTSFGPGKEVDPKENELQNERAQFIQEKFESTLSDTASKADSIIKSTIAKHIDPKGVMTDYVKRVAIKDAMESVEEAIENDSRFKAGMDKLWKAAFDSNFSREAVKRIEKAYLNKAASLLPPIIQKHRNEALRGLGKRINDKDEREEPVRKGPISQGRSATANNSSNTEKNKVPRGMTTLQFLNSD